MNVRSFTHRLAALAIAVGTLLAFSSASAVTWDGDTSTNWSAAGNWDTAPVDGNALTFDGTSNQSNTNDTALTNIGLLTLNGGDWNINLGTLTLNGGITASGTSSLSGALTLGGPQTWQNSTGLLTISGTVANGGNTLTVRGAGNTTISSTISGIGGLTKTDAGTLTLSGANTYTGTTTVSVGTLNLTGNRTAAAGAITVASNGILGIGNGNFSIGDNPFYVGQTSGTSTVNHTAGTISTGTTGAQLLIGNSSGTGIYNLSGGNLNINRSIADRGIILGVNTSSGGTFNLSDDGTLTMVPTAGLQIGRSDAAANNTTNAFNQTAGTATIGILRIGGNTGGSTGVNSTLSLTGGAFTATTFDRLAFGGTNTALIRIGGTADVTLPAFPTTALGAGSSATIEFDGGVLKNSAASTNYLGNISSALIKNGGAKFDTTDGNITITQALENVTGHTGSLTKEGDNTLTLSGANSYTGNTTISAGTLAVGGNGTLGNGNYAGVISGAGAFTYAGSGTTILSGANTYTGTTTVNGGTLKLTGARTAAAGAIAVQSGGILEVNNSSLNFSMGTNNFIVGVGANTSKVNHIAGKITVGGASGDAMLIGNGGAIGEYNLSGGTLSIAYSDTAGARGVMLGVGDNSTATFNLSGTGLLEMTHSDSTLMIGRADGTATSGLTTNFDQTGGEAKIERLKLGGTGTASNLISNLTLTGGKFTAVRFDALGEASGTGNISTITIGGTADVTLPAFRPNKNANHTVNVIFDGGVLKNTASPPNNSNTDYFGNITSAQIKNGGARIDTTAASITIIEPFQDFSGHTGKLTKAGTNTLTLSGASSYSGATVIANGTLALATGNDRLPTGTTVTLGDSVANTSGILKLDSRSQQLAGLLTAGTGTGTGNRVVNGSSTAATLSLNIASGTNAFGGTLGGVVTDENNFALTKTGDGVLSLSGTNTYTGATTVSDGTLYVTGALSNSAVTVQADGAIGRNDSTLGGGILGNGLTILAGGALDLTGATLGASSTGILSITSGSLTLGNLTFEDLVGWDWLNADVGTYELIDGIFAINWGSTAYISPETAYDFGNGKSGYFTSGSLITVIMLIPEPSTAILAGLGLAGLALRRRRR